MKRMPNGFGTVVRLSGNRRNPYIAKKTVGWNAKGHPVYRIIGYYPTKEAGLIALGKFNEAPWDARREKITLEELYRLWVEKKSHKLGVSTRKAIKSAFGHCSLIAGMRYRDIKSFHMQGVVDSCGRGHATQNHIKNVFYHLERFALELDLIDRRYADLVTVAPRPESGKVPFSAAETGALWALRGDVWVDSALILLYSGWRISELLALRICDIDLAAGVMRGGVKSRAGRGRLVPIHSKIFPVIEFYCRRNRTFLIEGPRGRGICYETYRRYWRGVMGRIGASHTPHECRHTFRSRLDSAGANKVCADLIMGHKSADIGERVYTHKTVGELKNAIELITD